MWSSGEMFGEGRVTLDDLNNDDVAEILVSMTPNTRGFGALFIFGWQESVLTVLNPSGDASGMSEFNGIIELAKSDSGAVITAFHPNEGTKRTFRMKSRANRIVLISEERVQPRDNQ